MPDLQPLNDNQEVEETEGSENTKEGRKNISNSIESLIKFLQGKRDKIHISSEKDNNLHLDEF